MATERQDEPNWIESIWAHREENVYAELFGDLGPGIYTLSEHLFAEDFRQSAIEEAWLHLGGLRVASESESAKLALRHVGPLEPLGRSADNAG